MARCLWVHRMGRGTRSIRREWGFVVVSTVFFLHFFFVQGVWKTDDQIRFARYVLYETDPNPKSSSYTSKPLHGSWYIRAS